MEPLEAAMFISALSDMVFRLGSKSAGMTPEEFKEQVEAQQVIADDLEDWLREG